MLKTFLKLTEPEICNRKPGRLLLGVWVCLLLLGGCNQNAATGSMEVAQPHTLEEILAEGGDPQVLASGERLQSMGIYEVTCQGEAVQVLLTSEGPGHLRLHFRFQADDSAGTYIGGAQEQPQDGQLPLLRPPLGRFAANQRWAVVWKDELLWLYAESVGLVAFQPVPHTRSVNSSLRDVELDRKMVPEPVLALTRE